MTAANEKMVLRTVYLPKALDLELRSIAFHAGQTKNELIRELVQEALKRRRPAEPTSTESDFVIVMEDGASVTTTYVEAAPRRTRKPGSRRGTTKSAKEAELVGATD